MITGVTIIYNLLFFYAEKIAIKERKIWRNIKETWRQVGEFKFSDY